MSFRDKSRDYQHPLSFSQRPPHDETVTRDICDHCGLIHYKNPKIITGVIASFADKILMCKRAIQPRQGFWTLPAGFMEENETTQQGAAREALEEAHAEIEIGALLGIYNVPRIAQVHIYYRGVLQNDDIACGVESAEVALFAWADIPWGALAFPSVYWALQHYHQVKDETIFAPFTEPEDWGSTPGFEDLARAVAPV